MGCKGCVQPKEPLTSLWQQCFLSKVWSACRASLEQYFFRPKHNRPCSPSTRPAGYTAAAMSFTRPSQCFLYSFSRPSRRKLHASAPQLTRKRPGQARAKASELPQSQTFNPRKCKAEYSAQDVAALSQKYSPAQLEAIQAAEADVPAKDIDKAAPRADPWSLNYFDDLSEIHPVVDKAIRAPWSTVDPNPKLKSTG